MSDKKFTWIILIVFAILTTGVVGTNFLIDPMWHYTHAHELNDVQKVINEREQKTAELKYQDEDFDTILIGSSRSTYISPKSFGEWNVYNYSVANLSMREYQSMMMYAEKTNDISVERFILGVDFFKSSEKEAGIAQSINNYESKVDTSFYRAKNLLSLDLLDYSIENIQLSSNDKISEDRLYNRHNTAFAKKLTEQEIQKGTAQKIIRFKQEFYGTNYKYYSRYKEIMQKIELTSPASEKIVYTTPISTELFKALVETDLLDEYEIWLRDLVEVFGGVWNFMYPNTITNNIMNYYDGHHFYPEVGDLIANRISSTNETSIPQDFGVYVTDENIDEHIEFIKSQVKEIQ